MWGHKLNLSDEETILAIQETLVLCLGKQPVHAVHARSGGKPELPVFDPSLFVTIRWAYNHRGHQGSSLPELAKRSGKDGDTPRDKTGPMDLKADATCADAEVRYTTDIDLVEDASKYVDRLMGKVAGMRGKRWARQRARARPLGISQGHKALGTGARSS